MAITVDVFIQAGGQSTRMGQNKALLKVGAKPILGHVIDAARPVAARLRLVTNDPDAYRGFGVDTLPDRWPGCAALGGIGTALTAATTDRALVLACDLPFVTTALLRFLIDLDPTADVTLPATDAEGPHPLCAVYARRCLPFIEERVAAKRFKVTGFFPEVRVRTVAEAELRGAGFDPQLLANVNTPDELARAAARFG